MRITEDAQLHNTTCHYIPSLQQSGLSLGGRVGASSRLSTSLYLLRISHVYGCMNLWISYDAKALPSWTTFTTLFGPPLRLRDDVPNCGTRRICVTALTLRRRGTRFALDNHALLATLRLHGAACWVLFRTSIPDTLAM